MKLLERFASNVANRCAAFIAAAVVKNLPPAVRNYADHPDTKVAVKTLYLTERQSITVFAGAHRSNDNDPPYSQIELRVTDAGVVELFCDEVLAVQPFDDWVELRDPAARAVS